MPPKSLSESNLALSYTKFLSLVGQHDLNEDQEEILELVKSDWEKSISSDWQEHENRIKNFSKICDFSYELSSNLSFTDLLGKVGQNFAEIDCANHLLREFKTRKIEKLLPPKGKKASDFIVFDEENVCVEVKYVSKVAKKTISERVKKALSQIDASLENHGGRGAVFIFSYDQYRVGMDAQNLMEQVKESIKENADFDFTLSLQLYHKGFYGDCYF